MPTYQWRCDADGDWLAWASIHSEIPEPCPTCRGPGVKVMTAPHISVNATPNKGHDVRVADARERRWDRDMPAYKELRRQGYQPTSVDGAADVAATVNDRMEIEYGKTIPKEELNHYREVRQALDESAREGSFAQEFGDHRRKQRATL